MTSDRDWVSISGLSIARYSCKATITVGGFMRHSRALLVGLVGWLVMISYHGMRKCQKGIMMIDCKSHASLQHKQLEG